MALTHWTTGSGLVVAEHASDEAAIGRALKQFDPRLVLQFRAPYYVVVCVVNDHYAPVVATWMDMYRNPLPLSSGLIEKVQQWHVAARNQPETVDAYNARRLAEGEADRERALEAIRADHRPYIVKKRTQVTLADVGKPRYWKRDGARPSSSVQR